MTATASDSAGNPVPGVTVRFSVTGANSASGSDTTDQDGQATFTYTGTNQGVDAISAFADNDDNGTQDPGEPADTATKVWFSGAARGSFVIGDQNATLGNRVTFWGAQWWKLNSLSGGPAPPSFKGFASNTPNNPPRCGDSWTSRPGNSSNPPATVPEFIAVIASSSITKSGSTISGNTPEVVVVKTDPGYAPNPGHSGTGTVVAEVCQS